MQKPIESRIHAFPKAWIPLLFSLAWLLPGCMPDNVTREAPFELQGISISEMQDKLNSGEYTSVQIAELYVSRINAIDQNGIALHAIIELNPDALAIAAERDIERKQGYIRGPLHGIPILVKDNIETGDRMQTTAGSLALVGNRAKHDAFVVEQLRAQGAIILGKANMTEWSNFRASDAISGWSSRGGQVKNPYVLSISPCGSSSGSAAAVAADMCMVAVGTSTNGSIACPASFNGMVGIRPTMGLVSRRGIIPVAASLDIPGAIGRSVSDAAILLGALIAVDSQDIVTLQSAGKTTGDFLPYLKHTGLEGKVIGIDKSMLFEQEGLGELMQQAIRDMKLQGATIVEVDFIDRYNALLKAEADVLKYEFKDGVNRYLANAQSTVRSLDDVIQFNNDHPQEVMPYFQQDLMLEAQAKGDLQSTEYIEAKNQLATMHIYLEAIMEMHNLDAFAGIGSGAYSPPAVAGWPSITLPVGYSNEVPIGITFFTKPYHEKDLLAMAYAFEQATKHFKVPMFLQAIKSS